MVGNQNLKLSCLQFADDTIFFREASLQNILTLKSILQCFEMASGMQVNFYKSSIIGINMEKRALQMFTGIFNYKVMEIPFTYLGLLIGANPRSLVTWNFVNEKIKKRLSSCR